MSHCCHGVEDVIYRSGCCSRSRSDKNHSRRHRRQERCLATCDAVDVDVDVVAPIDSCHDFRWW